MPPDPIYLSLKDSVLVGYLLEAFGTEYPEGHSHLFEYSLLLYCSVAWNVHFSHIEVNIIKISEWHGFPCYIEILQKFCMFSVSIPSWGK